MIARILNILFSSSFDTNKNKQKNRDLKKSRFFLCKCFFSFKKVFLHLQHQSQRLIGSLTYWLERISGSRIMAIIPAFQAGDESSILSYRSVYNGTL